MKETGLMFKAPLVRAILEGRKTQTRRVAKEFVGRKDLDSILRRFPKQRGGQYGQPGDRIYVRETFSQHPEWGQLAFRADGEEFEDADGWLWEPKWKPATHMPKELARIWLEITGVRVERLHDISESDCWAEGVEEVMHEFDGVSSCEMANRLGCSIDDAKPLFAQLWESTGGDWDANPWVWVVDFKVLSTTGRPA